MNEPVYFPEVQKVVMRVQCMNREQLLEQLDVLFGRSRLSEDCSLATLRAEAIRQVLLDFLNPEHPDYWTMVRVLS
jgi:hypothetical protein